MPFYIPIGSSADTTQRVQIKTETYDFRFRWNTLEEAWYCYLGLNGAEPKVKFKLVAGTDLLAPHRAYDETPNGFLLLVDDEKRVGRAGRDNIGQDTRFKVMYIDEDEAGTLGR